MTFPRTTLAAISAAAMCLSSLAMTMPAQAAGIAMPGFVVDIGEDDMLIEVRKGRSGTGLRGRDRDRDDRGRTRSRSRDDDRSRSTDRSSGRSRPRIPGGSGCDDPGDILEHPECSVEGLFGIGDGSQNNSLWSGSGRSRPRIPGGSGCDDPEDLIEHPECQP